jgi:hypothetical protein
MNADTLLLAAAILLQVPVGNQISNLIYDFRETRRENARLRRTQYTFVTEEQLEARLSSLLVEKQNAADSQTFIQNFANTGSAAGAETIPTPGPKTASVFG